MKVKDLIRELMDKNPDDYVQVKLEASLKNNKGFSQKMSCEADVDEVLPGNTPVLLSANLHMEIESTLLVY